MTLVLEMRNGVADLAVVTQCKGSRAAPGIVRAKGRSSQVVDGHVTSARSQRQDLVNWFVPGGGVIDFKRAHRAAGRCHQVGFHRPRLHQPPRWRRCRQDPDCPARHLQFHGESAKRPDCRRGRPDRL